MHSVISLVGKSNSGKTTLMEKLITELTKRGYKIAIVKHSHHADDLDTAKKDTWRFTQAGSVLSAINSLDHLAIYRRMEDFFDPRDISSSILWDYDIILTEGFKGSSYPKIEVHRAEQGKELLTDTRLLLAIVTDEPLDVSVPQLAHDDVNGIADIIEKKITAKERENDIDVVVNGECIPVNQSLRDLLARTLLAMVPGTPEDGVKSMHVSLRRKS